MRKRLAIGLLIVVSAACLYAACAAQAASESISPAVNAGALVSSAVDTPPVIDGLRDEIWSSACMVTIPMTRGIRGEVYAFDFSLRAVHTPSAIYYYAEWPGAPPSFQEGTLRNRLTVHYDLPEPWPGARQVACLVSCHTALMDEQGQAAHVRAETIPVGGTDLLPAVGGWADGTWRLEWSRPLRSQNLFDIQFDDLDQTYPFFVKVFEHREDLPDPVSATYVLRFAR